MLLRTLRGKATTETAADGFILDRNTWDSLPIDELVLRALDEKSIRQLENAGYLA